MNHREQYSTLFHSTRPTVLRQSLIFTRNLARRTHKGHSSLLNASSPRSRNARKVGFASDTMPGLGRTCFPMSEMGCVSRQSFVLPLPRCRDFVNLPYVNLLLAYSHLSKVWLFAYDTGGHRVGEEPRRYAMCRVLHQSPCILKSHFHFLSVPVAHARRRDECARVVYLAEDGMPPLLFVKAALTE